MVHAHAHRDRVASLKKRSPDDGQGVTVVYVTMSPDFDGPIGGYVTGSKTSSNNSKNTAGVGVGAPVQQTRSSSTNETKKTTEAATTHTKAETHTTAPKSTETEPTTTQQPTTTEQTTEATQATQMSSTDEDIASSTRTTFQTSTSSSKSSTSYSTSSGSSTTSSQSNFGLENAAITGSSSTKSSTSASATAVGGSGGLSGGAKAGIAIGVIVGVGLIAVLIFLWMRKKKPGEKELAENEADDEKYWGSDIVAPPPPPKPEPVTSPDPPQLNVRPITQFAPFASDFGSSGGFTGLSTIGEDAAVASGASGTRSLTENLSPPHSPQSSTAGSNPFNDPVDPFNNPSEAPSPARVPEESTVSGPSPEATLDKGTVATGVAAGATAAAVAVSDASDKDLPGRPQSSTSHASSESDPFGHGAVSPVSTVSPVNVNTVPVPTAPAVTAVPLVAPTGPGPAPSNVHRVHMEFTPSMVDEMELRAGDLVRLLHEYDDGWALCIRMDRSQQGVVPRSCLSSCPLKPRPGPPPGAAPGSRGPPMMGPSGPMSAGPMPQTPRFYPQEARPRSPARPMSPAYSGYPGPPQLHPYQRPMSPAQYSQAQRPFSPGPSPIVPRSLSPGPYGHPGYRGPEMPVNQRMRSNSTGGVNARMAGSVGPSPLGAPMKAMAMHPAAVPAPVSATIETVTPETIHE